MVKGLSWVVFPEIRRSIWESSQGQDFQFYTPRGISDKCNKTSENQRENLGKQKKRRIAKSALLPSFSKANDTYNFPSVQMWTVCKYSIANCSLEVPWTKKNGLDYLCRTQRSLPIPISERGNGTVLVTNIIAYSLKGGLPSKTIKVQTNITNNKLIWTEHKSKWRWMSKMFKKCHGTFMAAVFENEVVGVRTLKEKDKASTSSRN